jgi:multidrug efflux pump subunit AcrA (membrane-fusion protein)
MMRLNTIILKGLLLVISASLGRAQTHDLAPVISKPVSRTVDLPAEIWPYLNVSLHAKVPRYVERVLVDRGSVVKPGELLMGVSPEAGASQSSVNALNQAHQRARLNVDHLAAIGLRPRLLAEVATIVTPDSLLIC